MRLLRLHLGDYHILHDVNIYFDPPKQRVEERLYSLDFLVGLNGSGKSTVLRALARIFQALKSEEQGIDFPFEIEYWLAELGVKIGVRNTHPDSGDMLNGFLISRGSSLAERLPPYDPEQVVDGLESQDMPDWVKVIAYTTGAEEDWQSATSGSRFEISDPVALKGNSTRKLGIDELPSGHAVNGGKQKPPSAIFRLISKDDLPLVALCGLLVNSSQAEDRPLRQVFKEAKIKGFPGFSLRFNLTNASHQQRQQIYHRLAIHALRKLRSGGDVRLVFNLEAFALKLKDSFGGGLELFEFLSSLAQRSEERQPVLTDVALFIERQRIKEDLQPSRDWKDEAEKPQSASEGESTGAERPDESEEVPPLHTWNWLSDGERSFLARMCLFLLFGDTDGLILLDEPEVHFNDYWKRHIVGLLHTILTQKGTAPQAVRKASCHLLIATHSSIALTDVYPEDIIILSKSQLKTDTARYPKTQTFGASPGDIMVHVFGTHFAAGQHSVDELENLIALARERKIKKKDLQARLKTIAPGYWSYRLQREIMEME